MRPLVVLTGLPNVGKSTLFNALARGASAIVSAEPGTTRDRLEADAELGPARVRLADTGGWGAGDRLSPLIEEGLKRAVGEASAAVFVTGAGTALGDDEAGLARLVLRRGIPVVVACNKCDRPADDVLAWEASRLGAGTPVPVSALHGRGLVELGRRIAAELAAPAEAPAEEPPDCELMILGQPNVGKSSLFNRLVAAPRSLVDAEPGTTRDPVRERLRLGGGIWEVVDTAGVGRRWRGAPHVPREAQRRSLSEMQRADVALLVLDLSVPLARQDLRLAEDAAAHGLALAVALNKSDLVPPDRMPAVRAEAGAFLARRFHQLGRLPVLFCSAADGTGTDALAAAMSDLARRRRMTVAAAALAEVAGDWPTTGRSWRVRQVGSAPPAFLAVPPPGVKRDSRFVSNQLREAFGLHGVPLLIRWPQGAVR